MKTIGIYEIVNNVNGMRYVGSSNWIERRWRQHRHGLRHNRHENDYLQKAYNKYGEEDFIFSVIVETSESNILAEEESRISSYKWDMLYNLERTPTRPNSAYKLSEEQMKEISILYTESRLSCVAIAKRYGVGAECISRHLNRLGVELRGKRENQRLVNTDRTFTLKQEAKMTMEYMDGATIKALVKVYYHGKECTEVRRNRIRVICRRNGAKMRRYNQTDVTNAQKRELIRQRVENGTSYQKLANAFGVSDTIARKWCLVAENS